MFPHGCAYPGRHNEHISDCLVSLPLKCQAEFYFSTWETVNVCDWLLNQELFTSYQLVWEV